MAISQYPGVGPTNADVATAVATAVPNITQITSAVTSNAASAGVTMAAITNAITSNAASAGVTMAAITSSITANAASAGLTAAAIVSAGNAAGWAASAPPYGASATPVFSGYSSVGRYAYASNVSAGSYLFQTLGSDPYAYTVVYAPNSQKSAIYKADGGSMGILRVSTTENPIRIHTFGRMQTYGNLNNGTPISAIQWGKNRFGWANGWLWFNNGNVSYYTSDGVSWATANATIAGSQTYCALWDGTYYMTFDSSRYTRSTNLTSWASVAVTGSSAIYQVVYRAANTHKYVAACAGGMYTSTDGTTWTARATTFGAFNDVAHNNAGTYVAVGSLYGGSYNTAKLFYSTNEGVNWTEPTGNAVTRIRGLFGNDPSCNALFVSYGNGVFVVAGINYNLARNVMVVAWSSDGINWKRSDISIGLAITSTNDEQGLVEPGTPIVLDFVNGVFILTAQHPVGFTQTFMSPDGKKFMDCTELFTTRTNQAYGPVGITNSFTGDLRTMFNYAGGTTIDNGANNMIAHFADVPSSFYMYSIPGQSVLN